MMSKYLPLKNRKKNANNRLNGVLENCNFSSGKKIIKIKQFIGYYFPARI